VVLAELTEAAKARTEVAEASTAAALEDTAGVVAQRERRAAALTAKLRDLLNKKVDGLERRAAIAANLVAKFDHLHALCNSVTDWQISPARCTEIPKILALGNQTVAAAEQALAEVRRRLADLAGAPGTLPVEAGTAPGDPRAIAEDLTIEAARALVAATEDERDVDRRLEAATSELAATSEREAIQEVQMEVSYDSLRLTRFAYELVNGERRRELRDVSRYRVIEVDGNTRIILDGEAEIDPEVAELLAIESPCLSGELKAGLVRCRRTTAETNERDDSSTPSGSSVAARAYDATSNENRELFF
jgi:hypothetical protein